jgi:phosphoglycolate phosphatase-like HAD superfamily hydrolase
MKFVLFDIDGTLMLSGGAGLRAMARVFAERYGVADAFDGFQFQGKIDPAIFREALACHRLTFPDVDAEIARLVEIYIERLAEEMPKSTNAVLYPGVRELLEALSGRDDVSIGLLTGNVRGGARIKLLHFDLWRFFPFGAFGDDHEHRPALVPIALERASRLLGRVASPGADVYVVGDTDRDVWTAKENGCTAVGVGTLNFTAAQLTALGADIAFENFADTHDVLKKLGVADGR